MPRYRRSAGGDEQGEVPARLADLQCGGRMEEHAVAASVVTSATVDADYFRRAGRSMKNWRTSPLEVVQVSSDDDFEFR